jgi:hypothetical protein
MTWVSSCSGTTNIQQTVVDVVDVYDSESTMVREF